MKKIVIFDFDFTISKIHVYDHYSIGTIKKFLVEENVEKIVEEIVNRSNNTITKEQAQMSVTEQDWEEANENAKKKIARMQIEHPSVELNNTFIRYINSYSNDDFIDKFFNDNYFYLLIKDFYIEHRENIYLGIATFGIKDIVENMIKRYFQIFRDDDSEDDSFKKDFEEFTNNIFVVGVECRVHRKKEPFPPNKNGYINKIKQHYFGTVPISNENILLIDDTEKNIDAAKRIDYKTFLIKPATGIAEQTKDEIYSLVSSMFGNQQGESKSAVEAAPAAANTSTGINVTDTATDPNINEFLSYIETFKKYGGYENQDNKELIDLIDVLNKNFDLEILIDIFKKIGKHNLGVDLNKFNEVQFLSQRGKNRGNNYWLIRRSSRENSYVWSMYQNGIFDNVAINKNVPPLQLIYEKVKNNVIMKKTNIELTKEWANQALENIRQDVEMYRNSKMAEAEAEAEAEAQLESKQAAPAAAAKAVSVTAYNHFDTDKHTRTNIPMGIEMQRVSKPSSLHQRRYMEESAAAASTDLNSLDSNKYRLTDIPMYQESKSAAPAAAGHLHENSMDVPMDYPAMQRELRELRGRMIGHQSHALFLDESDEDNILSEMEFSFYISRLLHRYGGYEYENVNQNKKDLIDFLNKNFKLEILIDIFKKIVKHKINEDLNSDTEHEFLSTKYNYWLIRRSSQEDSYVWTMYQDGKFAKVVINMREPPLQLIYEKVKDNETIGPIILTKEWARKALENIEKDVNEIINYKGLKLFKPIKQPIDQLRYDLKQTYIPSEIVFLYYINKLESYGGYEYENVNQDNQKLIDVLNNEFNFKMLIDIFKQIVKHKINKDLNSSTEHEFLSEKDNYWLIRRSSQEDSYVWTMYQDGKFAKVAINMREPPLQLIYEKVKDNATIDAIVEEGLPPLPPIILTKEWARKALENIREDVIEIINKNKAKALNAGFSYPYNSETRERLIYTGGERRKSHKRKSHKRKSHKRKGKKRKSIKRKSHRRKSHKRKSIKRKSHRRKSIKRRNK